MERMETDKGGALLGGWRRIEKPLYKRAHAGGNINEQLC
jgi:hypothetical protein